MRRLWAGVRPRVGVLTGRARAYLVVLGLRHLAVGLLALLAPATLRGGTFDPVERLLGLQVWGALFVVIGLHGLVLAFFGQERHARILIVVSATTTAMWAAGLGLAGLEGTLAVPTLPITWTALVLKDLIVASMPLRPLPPVREAG